MEQLQVPTGGDRAVCHGSMCSYPGGGAFGYHFEDAVLVTIPEHVDEHQFELVRESFQAERFERLAGTRARRFVEELFRNPLASSFLRIGPNDLRLGCTDTNRWKELGIFMRKTFCEIYEFDAVKFT